MKAKKTSRIRQNERTKLQNVIPLETPFHVFVDPSAACNFKCKFCFNRDKSKTFHKIMEYELFEKIVNDMKQFPDPLKVLRMYKEGEPLLNKNLEKMIKYAKVSGICEQIDFTTNGSMLNPSRNKMLIDAGLDAMIISVEGITEKQYYDTSGVNINFKEYVENIKDLYKNKGNCRIHIKTTDMNINKDNEDEFYSIFGDICDEISIDKITPIWTDIDIKDIKDDFDKGIYNNDIKQVNVCPYIFYSLTINSDGSVSSCFMDWKHSNILGDVNEKSFYDIWNSKEVFDIRKAHLTGDISKYEMCNGCGQLKFGMSDNIDDYAENLLSKLEDKYPLYK
ncbi:radical SAM protein [Romboutsia maritimum]|uniref:Radical SAM protein n=1 Tax=Romboutsia maritimum TaxID=2020948 RepID=A0A371IVK3_9FIRM|nr:radical SAM/SPASM domain-containing protein [Romboutsia maritimum]RDY24512.1 radical SAM protein [Romboutsia maritimum]